MQMSTANLALVTAPDPEPDPRGSAQLERAARALIGWMKADVAHRMLASNRMDASPIAEHVAIARRARENVAARTIPLDQEGLVRERPAELEAHVQALRATPSAIPMFSEGWDVALVDLTRVCAFQPLVFSEQAVERVQGVDPDDLV